MNITKMSLVAALLIGSSAFAIENTKVSGDANVYYHTQDANDGELLNAADSAADIGLNLNLTTDLFKNDSVSISAGAGYTVLTTLGLENTLVNNVWGSAHTAELGNGSSWGNKVENAAWVNEAWVAVSAAKTTAKVGRMELDTPLAFTEKWSIEKNTFEAAVLINQDIPDTTLVGAFVGNGNGTETFGGGQPANVVGGAGLAAGGVVNQNGEFTTYGSNGAFAVAAINNSWKPLTVQAWYYNVERVATASWLQADLNVEGILVGAQYSTIDINKDVVLSGAPLGAAADISSNVYAVMLGYAMKDTFTAKVSYSSVGEDHSAGFNTATAAGTAQSKLYTEAWWGYGNVTAADTKTVNVTIEGTVSGIDLGAYGTMADKNNARNYNEATLTAGTSMGPVDATVAYIYANTAANGDYVNALQVYLTVNF